ncbi:MAG: oligosaccharide flippase family protein [Dysgonamonadaceae bacterium]|jgi:O-antigen/teichoic acid export membrane protein|nr:oligosaccharide flippase family protein [Dysgonamonadaceae bacterium]
MANAQSLLKDSVIYGGTTILVKMISWLMTPLFTAALLAGDFGIMTSLYAYAAVFMVLLTFGMETGLFRFITRETQKNKIQTVYSTCIFIVAGIVIAFLFVFLNFLPEIRQFLWTDETIPDKYIYLIILIMSMDVFMSIPFAYLRYQQRPIRFGVIKLLQVVLYALFCVFFLLVCPWIEEREPQLISWFWNGEDRLYYVFIANLLSTGIQLIGLSPQLFGFNYRFDWRLAKRMLWYSFPLVILGLAGMANQVVDKIVFPIVYPDSESAYEELGIYSACFKIALIMMMFTQAFRYAYDPFIFEKNKEKDSKETYALVMKYFVIFGLFVFLGVTLYLDIIKYLFLRNEMYYRGLGTVSVVLMGELFFAVYYNLSIWYKLTDKTYWGSIFSIIAFVIIFAINILFIPKYSFWACAWASLIGNFVVMLISYFVGQKYFPVKYDLKILGFYFGLALILFAVSYYIPIENQWLHIGFNTVLVFIYLFVVIKKDIPLKEIPFVNRFFK